MFNRFAEDHLKRWKDEYNDSKEQRPLPEMGSFLDEDERAKAIGMPPKPQYKASVWGYSSLVGANDVKKIVDNDRYDDYL